jgi:hypothetical protein
MDCLLESHFADIRKGALKAMTISYAYTGLSLASHIMKIFKLKRKPKVVPLKNSLHYKAIDLF